MRTFNIEKEFLNKSNCGTGIIYNQETEQFDVSLDIKTDHLIKVTWQELVDLKNQSVLEPGVFYRITDYEFTSTDPEVINAGHRFDIIVLALSEDILSEDARAIQHDFTEEEKQIYSEAEQHYFDNSNLAAWKLKYSLDGNSKRFAWAPGSIESRIIVNIQSVGTQVLYRNTNKDEGVYYAFSNDNYTYYTTSEEPVEGDQLYIKEEGQIKEVFMYDVWYNSKQILTARDLTRYYRAHLDANDNYIMSSSDAYTIDRSNYDGFNIIQHNNSEYIVVDENYNYIDEDGTTKTGILVTEKYHSESWQHNGNSFYVTFPTTFTDYIKSGAEGNPFSESYTFTLTKLPEIGDTIEVILGDDSYVPYTHITAYDQDIKLNNEITYVRDCTKVIGTIPKNTTYRGTIYGMIDEYENDCEYDFKNALITGKYSLFDPDQFYYTFTNQGSGYVKLKDGDTPVLLNPGTYTFLGCMPFRLYEQPNYITYVQPIITDEGCDSWDFYAALTDEEELDSETGETLYKVDMFVMPGYYNSPSDSSHQHLIRIFEDRKWYVKELIDPYNQYYNRQDRKNIKVYSKDSSGNIKEYSTKQYEYFNCTELFGEYLIKHKAWIYDACFKDNEQFQDFISLNIDPGFTFDIVEGQDNYDSDITNYDDYTGIKFVIDSNGRFGVYYQYYNKPYTIKWLKQGFPTDYEGDDIEFSIYEGTNYKFTKPITITEPMYVYLSSYNATANYADSYMLGDVMLSPKKTIESGDTGYDLYCTIREYSELNGDLYAWSFSVVNPNDTSCAYSYYGPDCYRVTLRTSYFGYTNKYIPKVIMDDVQFSSIEARNVFIQDCCCVKARNGSDSGKGSRLFLKNVRFSNLQDVDYCTIEDCYTLLVEGTQDSTFVNISNTHVFNCYEVNIQSVADSILENIKGSEICHISQSNLSNIEQSSVCSVNTSNILNLYQCYFTNSNSYGNYSDWYLHYKNIYINGLRDKTIDFAELLGEQYTVHQHPGHCVHIRSEEDLTITV